MVVCGLGAGSEPEAAEARGEVLPPALGQHQGLRGLVPVPTRSAQGTSYVNFVKNSVFHFFGSGSRHIANSDPGFY